MSSSMMSIKWGDIVQCLMSLYDVARLHLMALMDIWRYYHHNGNDFYPALMKLALDLHVNFCVFVCLFVCLSVCLSFRSFFQGV